MNRPKTAIVTGGSAGIGKATVDTLLAQGIKCVVLDRDVDAGDFHNETIYRIKCDISVRQEVIEAVASALLWSTKIDYLVHSAGFAEVSSSVDLSEEDWLRIIATNLNGAMFINQAVGRHMIQNGGGSIVNLGSVAGQFGWPHRLAYSCAKAGVEALSRTLAVEWAPHNIRVNTVVPSHVETPLQARMIASGMVSKTIIESMNPMHRLATPNEISEVIAFTLSEKASFVTGQSINVDGGFSAYKTPIPGE